MKVWLIQDILAPYRIKLFEKISQAPGIDFRLVLLARSEPTKEEWQLDLNGIPFDCELFDSISYSVGDFAETNISPSLTLRLFREKPDVVICAGYSFSSMQAYLYSRVTGRKYVIWMEGTQTTEFNARSWLRRWQRKFLTRGASALIDAGTLSHAYLKTLLRDQSEEKFFTSYNAVDNELIGSEVAGFRRDAQAHEAFRSKFPAKNILFVGRLLELKGIKELLSAYRKVVEQSGQAVGLIMLGSGPLEGEIEKTANDAGLSNVFLEGFINQDRYPEYLAIADVVAIPSIYDRNPLVLFEAMAAGCPVVISRHAGNAVDFVRDSVNGYIVDPEDIGDMADRILAILDAPAGQKQEMSAASLAMVKKANYDDSAQAFVDAARYAVARDE